MCNKIWKINHNSNINWFYLINQVDSYKKPFSDIQNTSSNYMIGRLASNTYLEMWIHCSSPNDIILDEVFIASPKKYQFWSHSNLLVTMKSHKQFISSNIYLFIFFLMWAILNGSPLFSDHLRSVFLSYNAIFISLTIL